VLARRAPEFRAAAEPPRPPDRGTRFATSVLAPRAVAGAFRPPPDRAGRAAARGAAGRRDAFFAAVFFDVAAVFFEAGAALLRRAVFGAALVRFALAVVFRELLRVLLPARAAPGVRVREAGRAVLRLAMTRPLSGEP